MKLLIMIFVFSLTDKFMTKNAYAAYSYLHFRFVLHICLCISIDSDITKSVNDCRIIPEK